MRPTAATEAAAAAKASTAYDCRQRQCHSRRLLQLAIIAIIEATTKVVKLTGGGLAACEGIKNAQLAACDGKLMEIKRK